MVTWLNVSVLTGQIVQLKKKVKLALRWSHETTCHKAPFNKWKCQYEHDHQTMTWLRCDIAIESEKALDVIIGISLTISYHVKSEKQAFLACLEGLACETLLCGVCHKKKRQGFESSPIMGATILDQVSSEQHKPSLEWWSAKTNQYASDTVFSPCPSFANVIC